MYAEHLQGCFITNLFFFFCDLVSYYVSGQYMNLVSYYVSGQYMMH